jgi:hypothetical protein
MTGRVNLSVIALAFVAIGLVWFGVRTGAAPDDDRRTVIVLSESEVAFIRKEMRGLLESVQDMLDAAAEGDRARFSAAARRAGMNGPEKDHIPANLATKLPIEFKKLGLGTHRAFDKIAAEVPERDIAAFAAKRLGETMTNCTACHSTFRIKSAPEK